MPTQTVVAHCALTHAQEAGQFLGRQIRSNLENHSPDVLLLFASAKYDIPSLLKSLQASCEPKILIGCTSAGEFISGMRAEGSVAAMAIRSDEMKFRAGMGRGLKSNVESAAEELIRSFQGVECQNLQSEYPSHSILLLTDALAGSADLFVDHLTQLTAGNYQIFGGGAGDDGQYSETFVFSGTDLSSDAIVGLEILSRRPVGVGAFHGWKPLGHPYRVTSSDGNRVLSINSISTIEVFREHARQTGQAFNESDPMPFFLHNNIAILTDGDFKLRVPMGILEDGSIAFAAEIPTGSVIQFMSSGADSSHEASAVACRRALEQMKGYAPQAAIFFDCVATRLRTGQGYDTELNALRNTLGTTQFAGFNTYGQIARIDGQFSSFHNSTAVVVLLPA